MRVFSHGRHVIVEKEFIKYDHKAHINSKMGSLIYESSLIKQQICDCCVEGFGCVLSCCVTTGGSYKLIFGSGTKLIIDTSKFIYFSSIGVTYILFLSFFFFKFFLLAKLLFVCRLTFVFRHRTL